MSTRGRNRVAIAFYLTTTFPFLVAGTIAPAYAGPVASLSRTSVSFGHIPPGFISTAQPVIVTNTGDAPLTLSGRSITGVHAPDFKVDGTCTAAMTLPPNSRCRLDFTMQASGQSSRSAKFTLQSDSVPPSPDIALDGLLDSLGPYLPVLPTPGWIDFPAQDVGTNAPPQTMTLSNPGSINFMISSIGLTGGNNGDFTLSSSCVVGTRLNAGGSCDATPGPRSTELVLGLSVGSNNGLYSFSVTGIGGAAGPSPTLTVVEYHHAVFDHYFITPVGAEIALLDAHAPPFQDWSRTGFSFNAYVNATAPTGSVAICRFFNDHFAPKSSHFYALHGFGCEATIAGFPDWGLEDDKLFNAMLPDAAGACPTGTIPVYRLYNNGMGNAPNHRFVTSLAERQTMINQGFVAEGNGIGVGMCAAP
jgi:hypothetical protein